MQDSEKERPNSEQEKLDSEQERLYTVQRAVEVGIGNEQ
jgi:hypothetical protein